MLGKLWFVLVCAVVGGVMGLAWGALISVYDPPMGEVIGVSFGLFVFAMLVGAGWDPEEEKHNRRFDD